MNIISRVFRKIKFLSEKYLKAQRIVVPDFYKKPESLGVTIEKRIPQLIVSLTSYPARIKYLHYTVTTLLNQSVKPDRLILWLAETEFPKKERSLPRKLRALEKFGLEILWVEENIRSYKKLVPALQKFPEDIIVTADDDIFYGNNWLELLYESYKNNKHSVHCHRAHRIRFDENGNMLPYVQWEMGYSKPSTSFMNFFVGVGGVLYPPRCFFKDVADKGLFMKLSPTGDDIWFWSMALLNNMPITIIKDQILNPTINEITQKGALYFENVDGGKNDKCLKSIFTYYNQLNSILHS